MQSNLNGKVTQYGYDVFGRRLYKKSSNQDFTLFGWDGDLMIWESSQNSDKPESSYTKHYVYEPDSFVPLMQAGYQGFIRLIETPDYSEYLNKPYSVYKDPIWSSDTRKNRVALEQTVFYHCDQVGTPQTLSNAEGACVWEITQDTWGTALEIQMLNKDNPFEQSNLRFQGQYYDYETGLHYNRYRYYEPYSARYLSKDPIGLFGGYNTSAYVSDPTQWVDPMGLQGQKNDPKLTQEAAWARHVATQKRDLAALKARGASSAPIQSNKTNDSYRVGVISISAGGDSTPVLGKAASSSIYFAKEKNGIFMGTSGTQADTIGFGGSLGLGIDWYMTDTDGFKGRADTSETCFIVICGRIHQNPETKKTIGYGISPLTEVGGGFTHSKGDTTLYHAPIKLINTGSKK